MPDFKAMLAEQRKMCKCGRRKSEHHSSLDVMSGQYCYVGMGKGAALGKYLGTLPGGVEEWEILCPKFEEKEGG